MLALSAACGAAPLIVGMRTLLIAERRLWTARPVPAVVIASAMRDSVRSTRSRGTAAAARVVVRHRYRVDGRAHESELAYPVDGRIPAHRAREVAARFTPGLRVTTHVPSGEPDAAFLMTRRERHHFKSTVPGILAGLGFLGFGVLFFRLTRVAAREAPEESSSAAAAA